MGKMEAESRKRTARNSLRKVILETVKAAGLVSIALVAPKVLTGMDQLGMLKSPRQGDVVKRSSAKLVAAGLLSWRGDNLRLTEKGERALRMMKLRDYHTSRPRRWDKKWRILIFDIPQRKDALRHKIRSVLHMIGFVRLQDSVWVYPYDCEDLITLMKADFHIGDDMRYMIVEVLERDAALRKQFKVG